MNPRGYLWGITAASFLALASFLAIIWFFSPDNTDPFILPLLFLSLFLALSGFFSLINFFVRRGQHKQKPLIQFLGVSFREGTLLSLLLVGFLLMKIFGVFYWWLALIFLIIIIAIEISFLYKE